MDGLVGGIDRTSMVKQRKSGYLYIMKCEAEDGNKTKFGFTCRPVAKRESEINKKSADKKAGLRFRTMYASKKRIRCVRDIEQHIHSHMAYKGFKLYQNNVSPNEIYDDTTTEDVMGFIKEIDPECDYGEWERMSPKRRIITEE